MGELENKSNISSKSIVIGITLFFVCLYILDECGDYNDAKYFRDDLLEIRMGVIVSCPSKSGNCVYEFEYNEKLYKGSRHCRKCQIGDSVSITFSTLDPTYNKIEK